MMTIPERMLQRLHNRNLMPYRLEVVRRVWLGATLSTQPDLFLLGQKCGLADGRGL